MFAQFTPEKLT